MKPISRTFADEWGEEPMASDEIVGVILAAGKGTRMAPFSDRYPKPILPICNKPLISYQVDMMRNIGIGRVYIVIGHLGHEIAQTLGKGESLGVEIRYIEQRETLGLAHAVGKLEPYIDSPMLLSLGDIFFVTDNLESMRTQMYEHGANAVLAVKLEHDPEAIKRNFSVLLGDSGAVKRVIEKPRHISNSLKGCGLYLFDQHVFDAVRRTPRTAMRDEYEITDTIQILVDDGLAVGISEVVKWDINVTFPTDVLRCNLYQLARMGKENLVGVGARVHPDAKLQNVVVGEGARIDHPVQIRTSVLFPNTELVTNHDIDGHILTQDHQINCGNLTPMEKNHDVQ